MSGYFLQLLTSIWVTLQVALTALILGLLLGLLGASAKLSNYRLLGQIITVLTNIIRSLPELLILFFVYYGSTILLSNLFDTYIEVNAFIASVIALSLIFGAYASETIRGAFAAIPRGQWEAAKAFGFSKLNTLLRIILPQLWVHALPGLGNLWFILLKDTALIALIGLPDIMRIAQNISASTQKPFLIYSSAALIYLTLTSLSLYGQKKLEKYCSRHLQESY